MQEVVRKLLDDFKPNGPHCIQQQYRQLLQGGLADRVKFWEARATDRHNSVLAQEVRVV